MDYASDIVAQGGTGRQKRHGGLSFLVIAIGTGCLASAWFLSASDPYTELAHRVVEVHPASEDGMAPAAGPIGLLPDEGAVAVAGPVGLMPDARPDGEEQTFREMIAALPPASETGTHPAEVDGVAPVPFVAGPPAGPDGTSAAEPITVPVEDFAAPAAPAEGLAEIEAELTRAQRQAIQRRLGMAGHDAGTPDGVFGPRTRDALASFQEATGLPVTGRLDEATFTALKEVTDAAYVGWAESRSHSGRAATNRAEKVAGGSAPTAPGKCARGPDGRLIGSRSLGCDLRGLGEEIAGVFGGGGGSGRSRAVTTGADR